MATKESKDTPELSDAAGIDSGASEVSSQPDAVPEAKKLRPLMKEEEISSNNPRGNVR